MLCSRMAEHDPPSSPPSSLYRARDAVARLCPRCQGPLGELADPRGPVLPCARCGGVFVGAALMGELVSTRAEGGDELVTKAGATLAPSTLEPEIRYLSCPLCGVRMNRQNFGQRSGAIVDVCKQHGTFFDAGELVRVVEFVRAGGYEAFEARRLAERKRESAELARVAMTLETESLREVGLRRSSAFAEGLVTLLAWLRR
jgi:Zn-finger nucleic acid-binding protein